MRSSPIPAGAPAALVGSVLTVTPGPADAAVAAGVGSFHGTAHISCFGCGENSGTADLRFSGAVQGRAVAEGYVSAVYTVREASVS